MGSSCITLTPGRLVCSHHLADTRTAGSCMLMAQSALPALLFAADGAAADGHGSAEPPAAAGTAGVAADAAPAGASTADDLDHAVPEPALQAAVRSGRASELDLRGGTDAAMAPPAGYLQHVLLPVLRSHLGVKAHVELVRRGFFPRGQGQVRLTVARLPPGGCLPALDLTERGEISGIAIRAFTAGRVVPAVGERLAAAAQKGALWDGEGSGLGGGLSGDAAN